MSKPFDLHDYSDIMDMPPPTFPHRHKMSMVERGAQFAPFAALTGYDAAVEEAARLTDRQAELTDDKKEELNARLHLATSNEAVGEITVTYFVPDAKKSGGAYRTRIGTALRVEEYESALVMTDGYRIPLETIREIDGDMFKDLEIGSYPHTPDGLIP